MDRFFGCCRSKDFVNYCCKVCSRIFHPSCLERKKQNHVVLGGYKILCSKECQEIDNDAESRAEQSAKIIEDLKLRLVQKDSYISRMKKSSEKFEAEVTDNEREITGQMEELKITIVDLKKKLSDLMRGNNVLELEMLKQTELVERLEVEKRENEAVQRSMLCSIETLSAENKAFQCEVEQLKSELCRDVRYVREDACQDASEVPDPPVLVQESILKEDDLEMPVLASAGSAVCQHETSGSDAVVAKHGEKLVNDEHPSGDVERQWLLRVIQELEEKNSLFKENCSLLREKVRKLEHEITWHGSRYQVSNVGKMMCRNSRSEAEDLIGVKRKTSVRLRRAGGEHRANESGDKANTTICGGNGDSVDGDRLVCGVAGRGQFVDVGDNQKKSDSVYTCAAETAVKSPRAVRDFSGTLKLRAGGSTVTQVTSVPTGDGGGSCVVLSEGVGVQDTTDPVHGLAQVTAGGDLGAGGSEEIWREQKVRRRRGRMKVTRLEMEKQVRPPPIRGCNGDFTLGVARQMSCLFLSGLAPEVSAGEVEGYIRLQTGVECRCERMVTRGDRYRSSFKVEIPTTKKALVLSPDLWGEGVIVSPFMNLRRRPIRENPMVREQVVHRT